MLSGAAGQTALAVFWLGVVLLLILALSRVVRLLPSIRTLPSAGGELVLRGSLALDSRRRLQLVQAGQHRILVLTGGTTDRLVVLNTPGPAAC